MSVNPTTSTVLFWVMGAAIYAEADPIDSIDAQAFTSTCCKVAEKIFLLYQETFDEYEIEENKLFMLD